MRASDGEAAELVALIDRLEAVLAASNLSELEVEVGETALVLRKPVALSARGGGRDARGARERRRRASSRAGRAPRRRTTRCWRPLTGLLYLSPSPDAAPYVQVGREVNQGQVIGLIEAMKLFNEIKSDVRGRVVRILAEHGALIKARQPLIEVDPS